MRDDPDFSDVTLVCDDNQQIKAHRIILTACSPFFNTVLKSNNHSHPMIYMRGTKAKDMAAIVDYIYNGEANIFQEDMDGFLALAEELKLKGLANADSEDIILDNGSNRAEETGPKHQQQEFIDNKDVTSLRTSKVLESPIPPSDTNKVFVSANISVEDLKEKLDSLMERVNDGVNSWKCTLCGKINKEPTKQNMRTHIETRHIEGLSFPCSQCDFVCKSNNAFYKHISRHHRS